MVAKSKPNELRIERVYDAPVKAVWEAWTDPEQVGQWWGPRGFTLTTHSKDLRPGGHWHYTMHGPDGTDYENKTKYFEVEKYARLVYDHGGSDERKPLFHVTVLFTDLKGKTKMEMTMSWPTAEAATESKKFIKKAGGDSTWDRLAEFLTEKSTGQQKFVINRSFEAPLETVHEMWTNPEHLSRWLPPTGAEMQFLKADIRAGGSSMYKMTGAHGTMFGRCEYQEMGPRRLVYTQQFCDEKGNVSRHPAAPTWPETMRTTVEFNEEGPAQTRVTVTWEVVGHATNEEMQTFLKQRGGMTQGWTGSFDKLEAALSSKRH